MKNKIDKISVVSPYKTIKTRNLITEILAEGTPKKGLIMFNNKMLAIRRWNLQGITIRSSFVITDLNSLKHLDDFVDKHIDTTSKLAHAAINLLKTLFNISIEFKIQDAWGTPQKNNTWSGMIGDLQRKEVEIGGSPVFFQKSRLDIIEYFGFMTPTRIAFILISPPLSHSSNIFTLPFAQTVWFSCFGLFTLGCFLLFFSINKEFTQEYLENSNEPKKKITLSDIVVYNVGAICQQGTAAETQHPSSRIITLFIYLAYMFLYISYSASIVAILQSSDKSIQTLSDLFNSYLEVGADNVSYSQYYFKSANDTFRKKFYKVKMASKKNSNFMSPEVGVEKIRHGYFAFQTEVPVGYQLIQKTFNENEKCGLQESKAFFEVGEPGLVMKKHSPYNELFRIGTLKLVERGFKTRYTKKYYVSKPICGSKSSRFFSIALVDCHQAFLTLVWGMITAVTIFFFEILYDKFKRHQNKKKKKTKK
ncbi:ionotropic glutamate receptor-invertebrate, putative [Pediculus humanus corporis]|uniref:Ionotropic glutamate receptor-invertebrate, putative n=1 Tax=Pediculus humanus subsp. corporis TaxID=121224 RepID=E0VDF6_PEDHC|nr:ionotropic glutamate receptor-invertebrate, putative [Pediculus humanus corporis]EEB11412.1 ionotropic glutamate receptor-invertebrate, putative [Pediculus humanus corporis]